MKKRTRRWFRFLGAVPYVMIAELDMFAGGREIEDPYRSIWGIIFGTVSFENKTTFVFAAEAAGFIVLFCILYGQILSEQFFKCGVYIFSRNPYRKPYLLKELGILYLAALSYSFLYFSGNLFVIASHAVNAIDRQCVGLILFQILYFSLVLYDVILLINYLSLKINPNVACAVGIAVVYLLIYSAMFLKEGVPLILNPFCIPQFKLNDMTWIFQKMVWLFSCTAFLWYVDFYGMSHFEFLKSEGVS